MTHASRKHGFYGGSVKVDFAVWNST